MQQKIGVLTIGDELLSGEITDANTALIGRTLNSHGLVVWQAMTVGDNEPDIEEALHHLHAKCSLVLVTGGLGSTGDDLTARVAARVCRRRLMKNEEALEQIRDHFTRRGETMPAENEKQALMPERATVLPNPRGTAPGFQVHHQGKFFFFLPGVPEELAAMLDHSVAAAVLEQTGTPGKRCEKVFRIFGLSEPKVQTALNELNLPNEIRIAFRVEFPLVQVRLLAGPKDDENLGEAVRAVRGSLGPYIVAEGEGSLAHTVVRQFQRSGLKLALAESCTGGLIAGMLTAVPGASDFFERCAVTYSNRAKEDWLKVPHELLESAGAVSRECALAMAGGIRDASGADVALAVTGIAGPSGGTPQKPVGTVFMALVAEREEKVHGFRLGGDRERIRILAAHLGLDWLRRHLADHPRRPEEGTSENR